MRCCGIEQFSQSRFVCRWESSAQNFQAVRPEIFLMRFGWSAKGKIGDVALVICVRVAIDLEEQVHATGQELIEIALVRDEAGHEVWVTNLRADEIVHVRDERP